MATYGQINAENITSSTGGVISPNITSLRNRIINGAMVINQRGFSGTAVDGAYTLDRWWNGSAQTSKFTVSQNAGSVTPPVGFSNYLGVTSSSAYSVGASDYFYVAQTIEGFNTADLGWGTANAKTVTLSAWIYSSLTGTFGGSINNYGSYNRSYPFTYSIPVANTWTQISITIAGDTTGTWTGATNSGSLIINFALGAGSSFSGTAGTWGAGNLKSATGATSVVGTSGATFYITGVQLEVGAQATSFDYRPYGTELALCYRYYYRFAQTGASRAIGLMNITATNAAESVLKMPVSMRTTPTLDYASGSYYTIHTQSVFYNFSSFGLDGVSNSEQILVYGTPSSPVTAGNIGTFYQSVSSGYFGVTAEL